MSGSARSYPSTSQRLSVGKHDSSTNTSPLVERERSDADYLEVRTTRRVHVKRPTAEQPTTYSIPSLTSDEAITHALTRRRVAMRAKKEKFRRRFILRGSSAGLQPTDGKRGRTGLAKKSTYELSCSLFVTFECTVCNRPDKRFPFSLH